MSVEVFDKIMSNWDTVYEQSKKEESKKAKKAAGKAKE